MNKQPHLVYSSLQDSRPTQIQKFPHLMNPHKYIDQIMFGISQPCQHCQTASYESGIFSTQAFNKTTKKSSKVGSFKWENDFTNLTSNKKNPSIAKYMT